MNRFAPISIGILALALSLVGCKSGGDGGGGTPDAGMGMSDAGMITADAGMDTSDSGPACTYPDSGYGTLVGYKFAPFTLPQCDGTSYDFVDGDGSGAHDFCSSTLTVVSIAAGWCHPCQLESSMMTDLITTPYADKGVRVIQVLVQDPSGNAPSQSFCDSWVSTYGLTNVELRDADGVTQRYFPDNSLPSTIIVDGDGVIQFRENGETDGLTSLKAKLDMLLAGS